MPREIVSSIPPHTNLHIASDADTVLTALGDSSETLVGRKNRHKSPTSSSNKPLMSSHLKIIAKSAVEARLGESLFQPADTVHHGSNHRVSVLSRLGDISPLGDHASPKAESIDRKKW